MIQKSILCQPAHKINEKDTCLQKTKMNKKVMNVYNTA